jgi:predicted DNA-binding transcriptional regulator AlpA
MTPRRETIVTLRSAGRVRTAQRGTGPYRIQTSANLTALTEMMADDRIILLKEAAVLLGVSPVTLQSWRSAGTGPPPIVVNRRARGYTLRAIRNWIRDHERT